MTRLKLIKIICAIALLYGILWAHEQTYLMETDEQEGFWAKLEQADVERAERFRLGEAGK